MLLPPIITTTSFPLPGHRGFYLFFVDVYPDLSSWWLIEDIVAAEIILLVMREFPVLMTISMIGAGAGSSRTDQIITNNKHSLGRN